LCLLSSLLVAGVIATYSTYPLKLESYNSIYLNKYGGTGTNHYQNMMAMHMGRFTIDTQGQTVRSFALLSNISNEFQFYGPTTWNPNTGNTLGFHGVAILKYGSQLYNSNLNQGNVNPINPTNTPMSGTITIDFYLISYNYRNTSGQYQMTISLLSPGPMDNPFPNSPIWIPEPRHPMLLFLMKTPPIPSSTFPSSRYRRVSSSIRRMVQKGLWWQRPR
jgi:hypothetical protein